MLSRVMFSMRLRLDKMNTNAPRFDRIESELNVILHSHFPEEPH